MTVKLLASGVAVALGAAAACMSPVAMASPGQARIQQPFQYAQSPSNDGSGDGASSKGSGSTATDEDWGDWVSADDKSLPQTPLDEGPVAVAKGNDGNGGNTADERWYDEQESK